MQLKKTISILNRKKSDPGKFIFTGDIPREKPDIQLFKYTANNCNEIRDVAPESIEDFKSNHYTYWLNVYGLNNPETIANICKQQNVHDLTIQDILDVNQRPKFQEFEDFSFLTIKSIVPSNEELLTEQISFVFGEGYLMSFQERKADHFEHLRYRLRENKGILRQRGSDYLLYTMLEAILDNYFKTLQKLENEIDNINLINTKKEPSPNTLGIIEDNKKFVHFIRKSVTPIKEFSQTIERHEINFIEAQHLKYFMEIKDLSLTLLDSCDILLASLESSTNLFFSVQGHRMNQVMKTLTVVATIFIPLTFVAGIYGMNFSNMPELEWKYGYLSVWIFILLIFLGMMLYFKQKKWF
ncbi:MAG: magnesium/cobalt transporter CorA [Prolixibacteraceae bacterium]